MPWLSPTTTSGTFTFLRSLPDHGNDLDSTPEQIATPGSTISSSDERSSGGAASATQPSTAYLRLKSGIPAPVRIDQLNGTTVAEQIGSQIFIDGWGMIVPGDPERRGLARRAGSVSHDGEAIYGAQVIAAMEAQAFVEPNLDRLIDVASLILADSTIARLIADIRRGMRPRPTGETRARRSRPTTATTSTSATVTWCRTTP